MPRTDTPTRFDADGEERWKAFLVAELRRRNLTQTRVAEDMATALGRTNKSDPGTFKSALSRFIRADRDEHTLWLTGRKREPMLEAFCRALGLEEERLHRLARECAGQALIEPGEGWHPAFPGVRLEDIAPEIRLDPAAGPSDHEEVLRSAIKAAISADNPAGGSAAARLRVHGVSGSGARTTAILLARRALELVAEMTESGPPGTAATDLLDAAGVPSMGTARPTPLRRRVVVREEDTVLFDEGPGLLLAEIEIGRGFPASPEAVPGMETERAVVVGPAPWKWTHIAALAERLSTLDAMPDRERDRLREVAEKTAEPDALAGSILVDEAITLLRDLVDAEGPVPETAELPSFRRAATWRRLQRGSQTLAQLPETFPEQLCASRLLTDPVCPWGPMSRAALESAVTDALGSAEHRGTEEGLLALAERLTAKPELNSLESFRDALFELDGRRIIDALRSQGFWEIDGDEVGFARALPLESWGAAGLLHREVLPWQLEWTCLVLPTLVPVCRNLARSGLSAQRLLKSLEGAPPWLEADIAWVVCTHAALCPTPWRGPTQLRRLEQEFRNALGAWHVRRQLNINWPLFQEAWPEVDHPALQEAGHEVLRRVSERYAAHLSEITDESMPSWGLPEPWPGRLTALERHLAELDRTIPWGDAWRTTLVASAPWQAVESAIAWCSRDPDAGFDDWERLSPAEVARGLDHHAAHGHPGAIEVLATSKALRWTPEQLRWLARSETHQRGRWPAAIFRVIDLLSGVPNDEILDAVVEFLRAAPDLATAILTAPLPSATSGTALRAFAERVELFRDDDPIPDPWSSLSLAHGLPAEVCIRVAERGEFHPVLEAYARVVGQVLGSSESGLRSGTWVLVADRELSNGLVHPESQEKSIPAPKPPPPDSTPATVIERLGTVAHLARVALARLGRPEALEQALDVEQQIREAEVRRKANGWLRGIAVGLARLDRQAGRQGSCFAELDDSLRATLARFVEEREITCRGYLALFEARDDREESRRVLDVQRKHRGLSPLLGGSQRGTARGGIDLLRPGLEAHLGAEKKSDLPHALRVARYVLNPDPDHPTSADERLVARALAYLDEQSDSTVDPAVRSWLAGLAEAPSPIYRLGAPDDLDSVLARHAAQTVEASLTFPGPRRAALRWWLRRPAGHPAFLAVHRAAEGALDAALDADDALLDEAWSLSRRDGDRGASQLLWLALGPRGTRATGGQRRFRRPWVIEALRLQRESTQRAVLPGVRHAPGADQLLRDFLHRDAGTRAEYAWAYLLSRAKPHCPEWPETLRKWALDDPAPLDGHLEFGRPWDSEYGRDELTADIRGGDGALLEGLRELAGLRPRPPWLADAVLRLAELHFGDREEDRERLRSINPESWSTWREGPDEALVRLALELGIRDELLRAAGLPLRADEGPASLAPRLAANHLMPFRLAEAWAQAVESAQVVETLHRSGRSRLVRSAWSHLARRFPEEVADIAEDLLRGDAEFDPEFGFTLLEFLDPPRLIRALEELRDSGKASGAWVPWRLNFGGLPLHGQFDLGLLRLSRTWPAPEKPETEVED